MRESEEDEEPKPQQQMFGGPKPPIPPQPPQSGQEEEQSTVMQDERVSEKQQANVDQWSNYKQTGKGNKNEDKVQETVYGNLKGKSDMAFGGKGK